MPNFKTYYFFLFVVFNSIYNLKSQCISIFPYSENFEVNSSWTAGGTASDWAWGTPNKSVINSAGTGTKCWVSGGLTGNSYANGEQSYVKSPCFDFTNLVHPYIQFKVFWESENKYDGMNLQYSTNNGASWTNVGTVNEVANCYTANWYNNNNVKYLSGISTVNEGWCGNKQITSGSCQGGSGSNGWVLAKHCLSMLSGLNNVIFRFTFGAGTTCNKFDGTAFDDILIEEAPKFTANFGWTCSNNNAFSFIDSSTNCPNQWVWNFGDPSSGASNSSINQNPNHTFTKPGLYNVTLTASNNCSEKVSITKTISVLDLNINTKNVSCPNGNDGSAISLVSYAINPINYLWSLNPIISKDTISNLKASNYSLKVSSSGTCDISKNFTITQPSNYINSYTSDTPNCGLGKATVKLNISGGTKPYINYYWPQGIIGKDSAYGLSSGNYKVILKDTNSCFDTIPIIVPGSTDKFKLSVSSINNISCFGNSDGLIVLHVNGGKPSYQFIWSPPISTDSFANNLKVGEYSITVIDKNNCRDSLDLKIVEPSILTINKNSNNTSCGLNNGSIELTIQGGTKPYNYNWIPNISTLPTLSKLPAGIFYINLKDSHNCVLSDSIKILPSTPLKIKVDITPDTCQLSKGTINVNIISGSSPYKYIWNDIESIKTKLDFLKSGETFKILVTDDNNCRDSSNVTIPYYCEELIYIPSAFSPNNDGTNDFFGAICLRNEDLTHYKLSIYNRWGELLFLSNKYLDRWDGSYKNQIVQSDVYVYILEYSFYYSNGISNKYGNVTLLR